MEYTTLSSEGTLNSTSKALIANNFEAIIVETKAEALEKIKELIPAGASVMNGASKTLEHIGYIEYLKAGTHGWNNLHAAIVAEKDPVKQGLLRKQALNSDFYLGSVHSLTETGEMLIASNTGSQLPHLAFTSPNLILVVGSQKITPNLTEAFKRLEQHVIPLEDVRMKEVYGYGTTHSKTLILHKENPAMGRKVRVVIVKKNIGF